MTENQNITEQLAGLTPAEIADVLRGARHVQQQRAKADGVETLAALFEHRQTTINQEENE